MSLQVSLTREGDVNTEESSMTTEVSCSVSFDSGGREN